MTTKHHKWLQNLVNSNNNQKCEHSKNQHEILKNKALVVAPMVDQSDLPFRLMCRKYGANLCFTPMFHARMFLARPNYRKQFWDLDVVKKVGKKDRPLIVQFCGSEKETLLQAAKVVEGECDGIDLNCGCPQGIARRGNYGAFLLEQEELLVGVVKHLVENLNVPVSVKVRLLPRSNLKSNDKDDKLYCLRSSIRLYQRLIDAGASMLTIHGRTRHQKGHDTGAADWYAIRSVVDELGDQVPIIANGGIQNMDDIINCFEATGAHGVMSSEAVLEYPPLFSSLLESHTEKNNKKRIGPGRIALAREFLKIAEEFPPDIGGQASGMKCVRTHIHHFLHADLQNNPFVRDMAVNAKTLNELSQAIDVLEVHHRDSNANVEDEIQDWYFRHRVKNEEGILVGKAEIYGKTQAIPQVELDDDAAECIGSMFGEVDDCW